MNDRDDLDRPLTTKIKSSGQVMFCLGCCCGKTERGLPAVPVDRIKAAWKAEKLNRVIQLTVSGCLGPCDVPNVAVLLTAQGMEWYGHLNGDAHYDAIIAWARESVAAGEPVPFPEALHTLRLRRFNAPVPALPECLGST